MKNLLLVLQALQQIKERVLYDIFGPVKDSAYYDECRRLINDLPGNIEVTIHKEVHPEKVKEVLEKAHVFILPSKSENFGHSIFEALSAGRPVITSTNTPWNHLERALAGINVSVENNSGIEDAIRFFAGMNKESLQQWQCGAISYAEKAIDTSKIKNQYRRMFSTQPVTIHSLSNAVT